MSVIWLFERIQKNNVIWRSPGGAAEWLLIFQLPYKKISRCEWRRRWVPI